MASRSPRPRLRLADLAVSVGDEFARIETEGSLAVRGPTPGSTDGAVELAVVAAKPGAPDHGTELHLEADQARALRDALDDALGQSSRP